MSQKRKLYKCASFINESDINYLEFETKMDWM